MYHNAYFFSSAYLVFNDMNIFYAWNDNLKTYIFWGRVLTCFGVQPYKKIDDITSPAPRQNYKKY